MFVLRYGLISLSCACADYVLFMVLYAVFHLHLIFAYLISYIIVSVAGFFGLAYFTFHVNKITTKNFIYFVTQLFFVAIIGYFILKYVLYFAEAKYAKLTQIFCTFFFSVFYGRFVTFKK